MRNSFINHDVSGFPKTDYKFRPFTTEMEGERFLRLVNEFTVNGERVLIVNFGERVPQKSKNYLTAAPCPPPKSPVKRVQA